MPRHAMRESEAWQRIGGEDGLRTVLRDFYNRLYADVMIGYLFRPHDKAQLVESQLQFTGRAIGGPVTYEGKTLRAAHQGLNIREGQFWRRHQILKEVLADHAVDAEVQRIWIELDIKLKPSVVGC